MPDHVKNIQSQLFLRKMQERKQIGSRITNLQNQLYRAQREYTEASKEITSLNTSKQRRKHEFPLNIKEQVNISLGHERTFKRNLQRTPESYFQNDDLMHCLESPVIRPKEGRPLSNRQYTSPQRRDKVKSLSISKIPTEKPKPVKRRIVFSTYDNL